MKLITLTVLNVTDSRGSGGRGSELSYSVLLSPRCQVIERPTIANLTRHGGQQ